MDREGPAAAARASHAAWRLTMIWLLVLGWPLWAAAQTETARLTGTATDATGGVLPGVTVTLVSAAAGGVRSTTTDTNGRYVIENLAPGSYELRFELSGFATQTNPLTVVAGQTVTVAVILQIGGQAEAVQVTGSLIPRPALEAMSPVTTLEIEELTYRGMTRLEDLLTTLPQVFTAQNSTVSNGSVGTATVNLRNMGDKRTLVLLDGRRMANGDAWDASPDLNFIPLALVKRVDVLTGGASAVYGADAVAGVVNFVLDRDFTGVRGGVEFSGFQHDNRNALAQQTNAAAGYAYPTGNIWNGGPIDFNFAFGSKFADGKGHAAFYLDYRTTTAITKDQRDYTACSLPNLPSMTMTGPVCGGNAVIPAGLFVVYGPASPQGRNYVLDLNPTTDPTGDQLRPPTTSDPWNYAPYNFMQRDDRRWAGGAFMNYQRDRHLDLYGDVMFMTDVTDSQLAPSGDFGNTTQLNCDNPMLSAQEVQLLCTNMGYGLNDTASVHIYRRSVESGPRVTHMEHNSLRFSAGARGDINDAWKYDAYFMQAEVHAPWSMNDFDISHLRNALLVTGTPGQPSTWHCISDAENCVPWDIFKAGGVTQEALNYVELKEVQNEGTRTRVVSGRVTGDLKNHGVASPAAVEGIKVAVGAEYRQEYLFVDSDSALEQALGAGAGGPIPSLTGGYSVKELFAEGLVPLVQDHWIAKDLGLEVGYRFSRYSTTGSHSTYKLQTSWALTPDLKLRVGYNRAVRSPNIQEMYTPQGIGLGGSTDLCAGVNPAATLAQCQRMGVTAAQYGNILGSPAGYNALSGGNLHLSPEVADTWTAGLVATPRRYVPGFTLALDYFHIKLDDTIGSLKYEAIMNGCAAGNTALCAFIHRDQLGSLWLTRDGYIETNNQNVGMFLTEGLDVNGSYTRPVGSLGLFTASLIGTYMMKSEINTGFYDYDCAGYFGNTCWNPLPRWRHLARFSWETTHGVTLSVGWRLLGRVTIDYASPNSYLAHPEYVARARASNIYDIPTTNYLDFGVTWKIRKGMQFVAGCNNVFDKEPPLAPGMAANDYATGFFGTYDPLGRYIHVGMQFTF